MFATGFRKSLCYACLPLIFDAMTPRDDDQLSVIIILMPLMAIMKDQVSVLHVQ